MIDERELFRLYRRIDTLERWVSDQKRLGPAYKGVLADFMYLPYLRGFWPMAAINESSQIIDYSHQARHLTINGGTGLTESSNNNHWYVDCNGTTQYLSRADEAGLDITNGYLTMGGWVWRDTDGAFERFINKANNTGNQRAYRILRNAAAGVAGVWAFEISSNGTATTYALATSNTPTGAWEFVVARITASTEMSLFINNTKYTNTTSIPAAIFNSSAEFRIGADSGGTAFLDGRVALCFLTNSALSDATIYNLYTRTWPIFANAT